MDNKRYGVQFASQDKPSTGGNDRPVKNSLSEVEQLAFSTIRIECDLTNGGTSTGTGFFFRFADTGTEYIPAIVTNKHVIEGAAQGRLLFTLRTADGQPDIGKAHGWKIKNFESQWILHPDPTIDLCLMPISGLLEQASRKRRGFFFTDFHFGLIPSESEIDDFVGLERIVMVGYPNGIWDVRHNLPVYRSGVLATNYRFDWNGKPEFLIDCACFPGSSGSPVLIFDLGQYHTRRGMRFGAKRIKLLGILYAGPQHDVDGTIEIVPVPTTNQIVSRSHIPNNLGMVIKARKLKELDDLVKARIEK
jgi:hypothetical protein